MPIKPIITDKKQLRKPCRETTIEEAIPVIMDLMDTANKHRKNCAGLAANQIGSDLRVFVVKVGGKFIAFVNPEIVGNGGIMVNGVEGCLSHPGKQTNIKRWHSIETTPPKGKHKGMQLYNMAARAFQHELDHLNGKLI